MERARRGRVRPVRTCTVPGCGKQLKARGWCAMHYWRWKYRGDPNATEQWHDPLTGSDYAALIASVTADANRLVPLAWRYLGTRRAET